MQCLVLLPALSACVSLPREPDSALPFATPGAWSTGAAATSLAGWWQAFDDPRLTQLVDEALGANTDVAAATASLREARALRDVAAATLWPSLDASASAQRGASGGVTTGNRFAVAVDAAWEIDLFGGRRMNISAAEAVVRSRAASLGDVQVAIAAEVAVNYLNLRLGQARLAIADDNLRLQDETRQLTDWRLQAGLVTELEAAQAAAAADQTRALLPGLRAAIAQSGHALAVLTGQPPASLGARWVETFPVPVPNATITLSLPVDTLRQRPDVRAAEADVSAAWARLASDRAARLPTFRLGGSVGVGAARSGALFDAASRVAQLVASLAMPLLDGGARSAQVQASVAALDQARAIYAGTALRALQEVEDALVALTADQQRRESLGRAATSAGIAADLARQRYDSGLVDFQVVLDTQRTRLSTQDSLAVAVADLSQDHVQLYRALGGGWQPDTGNNSP